MNDPNQAMLLTEDGHRIGDIVVASGEPVDTDPTSAAESEEAGRELVRRAAVEMTGDPDADSAVASIYEGYGDDEKKRRAMKLFVVDHLPIAKVAEGAGVPERTVSMWIYEGKWGEIAAKDAAARQLASAVEMDVLRSKNRVDVAYEQLAAAKLVRTAGLAALGSGKGLKSAADAIKSAADVESRILGISDSGALDAGIAKGPEGKGVAGGKVPLVMIFNGGLPPRKGSGQ